MPIESHDEFLELCALSASGELDAEEQQQLEEHLAVCGPCREAKRQFEVVTDHAIPALAASMEHEASAREDSWSLEAAEAKLLARLGVGKTCSNIKDAGQRETTDVPLSIVVADTTWRHVWTLYGAGILLFISLGFSAYQFGIHRSKPVSSGATVRSGAAGDRARISLEQQLSDLDHEREIAQLHVLQRDKIIVDLRRELEQRSAELGQMRAAQEALKDENAVSKTGQQAAQENTELAEQLESTQSELKSIQARLDAAQEQSSRDAAQAAAMQVKVGDLTRELEQRNAEISQQRDLLAHDRDIRELMGARDLYITEVYDVGRSGETEKPYGRVFYTKDKSLIFYAYDLDQQAGLKNASTFQAWGRRGPDRQQAVNLGVFYQDNAAKRRWVLKFDDPKTLAQIDAVFVTVEPNGASRKPVGKSLLFAYLKVDPNHP